MRVGVVGAGIAGLRTAMLLENAGHEVTVFEARDRVGGRMHTVERGDGWYEAGGEWIDADHHRVLALMREFGIAPEKSSQWPGIVVHQGEFAAENQVWPDAEKDAELVHEGAVQLIEQWRREGNPEGLLNRDLLDLEGMDMPLGKWLDRVCATPEGRWWVEAVTRSDEGEDTNRVGLLGWLRGYAHYLNREEGEMSLYRIAGGGGRLCERMAERLRDVRLGAAVEKVFADSGEVVLMGGERLAFDRVVGAVPGPILDRMTDQSEQTARGEIRPTLDVLERRSKVRMARAVKVVLEFSKPWWREKGWTGRMLCDLPCQQTWEIGRGNLHALGCYVCGDEGVWLAGRTDGVEVALRALAEIHPEAQNLFIGGAIHDWVGDEFSWGAFPFYPEGYAPEELEFSSSSTPPQPPGSSPGQALPNLREGKSDGPSPAPPPLPSQGQAWGGSTFDSWGKLHLAGDWACGWMGFIEGALESAERVAGEIG